MKSLILVAAVTMAAAGLIPAALRSGPTALAAVSPATSLATSAVVRPAPAITWRTCTDPDLRAAHAQCGTVPVPLDYSKPTGPTITLAISRIGHTVPAAKYQGILLVNPGGPGVSGLAYSTLGQYVPHHAGDAYDWIGFDPRGVGASRPALSCLPNYFAGPRPWYLPASRPVLLGWLGRSRSYAQACQRNAAALLPHLKTTDSARDMDSIRQALGAAQLTFYGFSYGTYLGQVYATLFPTRVRRMVLDSNVDPRDVWYRANLAQDVAFDRNIKIWFTWLAKYDTVFHLGRTESVVEQLFYREQAALRGSPAGGVVGADEWVDIFQQAGYYQATWVDLGTLFSSWVRLRSPGALVQAYRDTDTPGQDNGFAVYNAVQCTDVQWPRKWITWATDNWRTFWAAPFETWSNAWFNAPCLYWPAPAGTPVTVAGGTVRALLIGETLDAATPFAGSLEVRRRFPRSTLIAEPGGTTHAGTLFGDACVDDKIAGYLATGGLPARRPGNQPDVLCAPLPVPVPSGLVTATRPTGMAALRAHSRVP